MSCLIMHCYDVTRYLYWNQNYPFGGEGFFWDKKLNFFPIILPTSSNKGPDLYFHFLRLASLRIKQAKSCSFVELMNQW